MGDYKNLYRSYYLRAAENNNFEMNEKHNIDSCLKRNRKGKGGVMKKLMFQTAGAVLFLLIAIAAKNSSSKDVKEAFAEVKEAVNEKYKIEMLQDIKSDISKYFKDFKEKININNFF